MASLILWRFQRRPVGLLWREKSSTESSTTWSGLITDTLPFVLSLGLCIILSSFCCLRSPLYIWRNGRCRMPTWSPSLRLGVVFGMRCHSFTGGDFDTTLSSPYVVLFLLSREPLFHSGGRRSGLVLRQAAQRSQQHRATEAGTQWSFWARQESHSILRSLLREPVTPPASRTTTRAISQLSHIQQSGGPLRGRRKWMSTK